MRTVLRSDHEQFRHSVRRFVASEIVPFHAAWEEAGIIPHALWRKAGEAGLLCCAIPEEFGGGGGDFGHSAVVVEELARVNASGPGFSMHSDIVAAYILEYGTEEQKHRWLPAMARGEKIGALAMTEPGTGSDVKAIRTSAVRVADHYVVNGQKLFITNGQNAGIVIVAVKTSPELLHRGVSLLCVEDGMAGFVKGRLLDKIGLRAQDTAELFFSDVKVPAANLLGQENAGFGYLMHNLPQERMILALRAAASMEGMFASTVAYTRQRNVFGKPLIDIQNTKFKLAECKARIAMFRAFVDGCLEELMRAELAPDTAAMAKLLGTEMQGEVLDQLLQLHGGYGYMSEYVIGRAWRDARAMRIYGGSSEIMKEIISRNL